MSDDGDIRVLFLRGINVGGRNRLPMADLRAILTGLGFDTAKTHIQSGNAVVRGGAHLADPAKALADAIARDVGFRPQVMALSMADLRAVMDGNPFSEAGARNGAAVQIGFLARPAIQADEGALAALAAPDEAFHLSPSAFYLHAPSGIGRSVLAARAEKLLGVPMTMRNYRVAEAVLTLAQTLA